MQCSKENMIKLVEAAGQEIIDRAEDIIGEGDFISDLSIWIRLNPMDNIPTIEVQREHLIKNSFPVLGMNCDDK